MTTVIRKTDSVCPVCLKRLPAVIVKEASEYFLDKTCADHGRFSTVIWRGNHPSLEDWENLATADAHVAPPNCPHECGLCSGHLQKTCCALVETTLRCNLNCPYCFAQSADASADPSVEQLSAGFTRLANEGNLFVQLTGGEPTVRDDLPDIVAAAKAAGCETIQLNSNGIRIGQDRAYLKALAEAGLSFVFLQFDGVDDDIYRKLRGQALLAEKLAAIEACADARIGVTLVPTIVPGVNDHSIGRTIEFAIAHSPAVRGVHFQPISYFGRHPEEPSNKDRITLAEVLCAIEEQTGGRIKKENIARSACDHPRCGFHGDFVVLPDKLLPLTSSSSTRGCACDDGTLHLKSRKFVSRRWTRPAESGASESGCCQDFGEMDAFLGRIKSHGFTITAMAFQDAYTLEIGRLRRCSLHVCTDGRMIPFCANYLTPGKEKEMK